MFKKKLANRDRAAAIAYLTGDYEEAGKLIKQLIDGGANVRDYEIVLEFCESVVSKNPLKTRGLKYRLSANGEGIEMRCKYCGEFTHYTDPNDQLAYLGMNQCDECGRSYAMPSVYWDHPDGFKYIYKRGSVTDREFYHQYEARFPTEEHSEPADFYLERSREVWNKFDPTKKGAYIYKLGYSSQIMDQETEGIFSTNEDY